ncbi:hypothetical protein [Mesorhizobium sp. B1-1-8]|uniref:hypothetical protein n=1 Tax=Mesorhizobium sp. B1-1-8 TaxID=2589976 RepID=UPI0011289566|nr:hypothetical protein [Mesorhizobium sp. B1-1-8]UCI05089.1 hypothetical protein FJ974_14550 [Mesorhizobium sp. B1-1-8]
MIRFVAYPVCLLWTLAAAAPALAAPECLANGKSFKVGETACLTLAGETHLARCDMVLNNTSWTKIEDGCPGAAPKLHPTSTSTPAPGVVPTEPTEN